MPTLQLTRDVPGIDSAFLAMDTEEGVEVVWNEVFYSNRKLMKGTKVGIGRASHSTLHALVLTPGAAGEDTGQAH